MSTNFQYVDLAYLDLMSDNDMDMKLTMLEMLLEEIPVEMEKMESLIQTGDWKELREVSHKMKSTLAFIGNEKMTEANKNIEEIAKVDGATADLPDLMTCLLDLYPKTLEELKLAASEIQV